MALGPWVSQVPHSRGFPATSNFSGIWLLIAVVGSGLPTLGFPAANTWTAAQFPPGRWCFTKVGMLGWDRMVG